MATHRPVPASWPAFVPRVRVFLSYARLLDFDTEEMRGRLAEFPAKGFDRLLQAVPKVRPAFPPACLTSLQVVGLQRNLWTTDNGKCVFDQWKVRSRNEPPAGTE